MKTEAGTALIPAGCKERIQGFAPDIWTHAATIVGKTDFDIVVPECLHPDVDGALVVVRKGVYDRVKKKIGRHLAVWSRIAVHGQIGLALEVETQSFLFQASSEAHDDLFGQVAEIEDALI